MAKVAIDGIEVKETHLLDLVLYLLGIIIKSGNQNLI